MDLQIKNLVFYAVTLTVLLSIFTETAHPIENNTFTKTTLEDLSYKQEIKIPIDTSKNETKLQPIDIHIQFENPCWAKNEEEHSIRVAYENTAGLTEIESQIYDLEHSDETHIKACNLVFIIPKEANGDEKYYVYYDPKETSKPAYEDHIEIVDTNYFYEPISGQKINIDYYGFKEHGFFIYAVIQKGELLGNPVSQSVMKFKPGSTIVETYNQQQLADFDMRYSTAEEPGYYGSSWAAKIEKKILIDGNLMGRVRLTGTSPKGDVKTDNIYTYYYSPGSIKRIFVNIHHEVLKKIEYKEDSVQDGTFAGISSLKARSATIDKMNIGEILPALYVYGEDNFVKEYPVPPDPNSEKKEPVLSTEDDIDLGEKAWISLSDPATGEAHGMIFESNKGFGEGEKDGVQVKAYTKQNVKLPGLEADSGSVYLMRNAYETGGYRDLIIPAGYKVNFNAEFITVEKQGYERIASESETFQKLVKSRPTLRGNQTKGTEEKNQTEKFTLTTYVHLAPSIPMGSLLSAGIGKKVSYIYAELYKDGTFRSSGAADRLPIRSIEIDLKDKKLVQKIRSVVNIFDWRNLTFFKKIRFPNLEKGTYLVKIYKENPLTAKTRQFIGFKRVDIQEDTSTHVICTLQGNIKIHVVDKNNNGLENVYFTLSTLEPLSDQAYSLSSENTYLTFSTSDSLISEVKSDEKGEAEINAPCNPSKPYVLTVFYQGFLVEQKNIVLRFKNKLKPLCEHFQIETHDLNLEIRDKWGLIPDIDITVKLTSSSMVKPMVIQPDQQKNGVFFYKNIYPADYQLSLKYKSFNLEEEITVKSDKSLSFTFPAEYNINFLIMNSYGLDLTEGQIEISRGGEKIFKKILNDKTETVQVPPGVYDIKIYNANEDEIAKQKIDVKSEKNIEIVTNEGSFLHETVTYLGVLLIFLSFLIWIRKKDQGLAIKMIVVSLILIAFVSPWWELNGEDNMGDTTNTKTLLIPPKIVTLTVSSDAVGGGLSSLPSEVSMILSLIVVLLIFTVLFVILLNFTVNRFRTTLILRILSIVFLTVSILIFYMVMSMLAEIGVGGVNGNGEIETDLPGLAENVVFSSHWGLGMGFYLTVLAVIILVLDLTHRRIKHLFLEKNKGFLNHLFLSEGVGGGGDRDLLKKRRKSKKGN